MVQFVMKDGPARNNYIGPSGQNYIAFRDSPFNVRDENDVEYFDKKCSFERFEVKPKVTAKPKTKETVSKKATVKKSKK